MAGKLETAPSGGVECEVLYYKACAQSQAVCPCDSEYIWCIFKVWFVFGFRGFVFVLEISLGFVLTSTLVFTLKIKPFFYPVDIGSEKESKMYPLYWFM